MKPKSVLIVEDDRYFRAEVSEKLQDRGIITIEAATENEALKQISLHSASIGVALIDLRFPVRSGATRKSLEHGRGAGLRFARAVRKSFPHIRLIGMSAFAEQDVREWFAENGYAFLRKNWLTEGGAREFIDQIERAARKRYRRKKPQTFIVHGHDCVSLHELVGFIARNLRWPQPKILRELPSSGLTIIEKFEDASHNVDIVFVLLTPDDKAAAADAPNIVKRRARQNVIFELGYFFAKLQRVGGKVILLHKGDLELPSDISGVVYVDISNGVEAAGESLRRELKSWLWDY